MVPLTIHLKMRNYVSMDMYDDQPEAPAVLHTSRESRMDGMRYYNLCRELKSVAVPRGLDQTWDRFNYGRRNVVWINFNVDRFSYRPIMLMFLSIDGDEEVHREKSFNFEGAVVQRIRNLVTHIDGRDKGIAMDLLRRLGRVFGRESIKVLVVPQRRRLYEETGVPVLMEYRKQVQERTFAADLETAKLASGWDVTWQIEEEFGN
jgi:hypothetical protein